MDEALEIVPEIWLQWMKLQTKYHKSADNVPDIWLQCMKLQTKWQKSATKGWNFRQSAKNLDPMDEVSDKVPEIWFQWMKS